MKSKKIHLLEYNSLSYFLVRSTFVGISLNNLLTISKQDSWLAIIIAFIIGFIPLGIFYLIINNNSKENIIDFIKNNCGNLIGTIINIIITIFVFIFSALLLWNLVNFISSQYLYKTPNLAILLTFIVTIYYLSSKSINVIGRTSLILFYISISLFIFSFIGLFFNLDISNIKPTFEFGILPIFKGSFNYISYNVLSLFLLLIIPKDNINTTNKHLIKNTIIVYFITTLGLFFVTFFLLSTYGISFSQILQYPSYHILKRISILSFIERVESILSIQWILDLFMVIVIGIYFVKTSIRQTFKISNYKFITFILIILLIPITTNLFKNNTIGNIVVLKIFPFFNYLFFLIIPTIILIYVKIRKKNKDSIP